MYKFAHTHTHTQVYTYTNLNIVCVGMSEREGKRERIIIWTQGAGPFVCSATLSLKLSMASLSLTSFSLLLFSLLPFFPSLCVIISFLSPFPAHLSLQILLPFFSLFPNLPSLSDGSVFVLTVGPHNAHTSLTHTHIYQTQ